MTPASWSDEVWSVVAVGSVTGVALLSRLLHTGARTVTKEVHSKAVLLMKQALRWHAMSLQDKNPVFGMRHANYASAYLEAARSLVSDEAIQRSTSKNVQHLKQSIEKQQERMVAAMGKSCPALLPKGTNVASWIE